MPALTLDSPVGALTVTETEGAITALTWGGHATDDTPLLRRAAAQLTEYFSSQRKVFDLPLDVRGSAAQTRICAAIAAIPFGETRTYGNLSRDLDLPAQAVGRGCGGNPIPILIPCHRVLGAQGLGGFSGGTGIETKIWLLKHEGAGGLLI